MESIDKNDVDIKPLFRWGREVSINDASGNPVKLYMRIVGDAELNRAKVYGLRKSKELRKSLRDPDSPDRMAFVPDWEEFDMESIATLYVSLVAREIVTAVTKNLDMRLPLEPKGKDVTLEQEEEYQAKVDAWTEDRRKLIEVGVAKEMEKRKAKLLGMTKKQLIDLVEKTLINELCEEAMYKAFQDWIVSKSIFVDSDYKELLFDYVEEYEDLMASTKEQLASQYEELSLGMVTLKK
jgi:hypothetical protein